MPEESVVEESVVEEESELMDSTSSSLVDTDNVIEVVMGSSTDTSEEINKSEEIEELDTGTIETEQEPLVKISSINDNMLEPFDFSEVISTDVKIDFNPKMYTEIYSAE